MGKTTKYYILPLAILAVAAFLRFYHLNVTPPGLFHDEAMNGVDALDVIYNGYHPLYFERNQGGREPLFIYLTTASIYIWGATPFSMRLVAAFIGILTVALTFALAKSMFGQRVATIASALLALSQWHTHFSRTSFRAISFPLLETITIFLLWKGITSGRLRYYAIGGLAAGLTMYTYFSSRLFPILLGLFLTYLAAFYRQKISWRGVGLFCAVGFLVFSPLGYYYLTHQYIFFARISQVSAVSLAPQVDSLAGLWESTVNTLGMFNFVGDINWKYNLPGKPLFDHFTFVLFLAGLLLAVFRAKRHPAQALMVIWLAVMLLPGVLSTESPSFLRALGIVPVVFILPALAADAAWLRLTPVVSGRSYGKWVFPLVAVVWFAFIGISTFRDYFSEWAGNKETYYAFNTEMTEIGRFINTLPDSESVFLSSKYYHHPSVLFFLRKPLDIRWFNGSQSLVFPDSDEESTYIFPYSAMPRNLGELFPTTDVIATAAGPDGSTAFVAYRPNPDDLRQKAMASISQRIGDKTFGDTVRLDGYKAAKEVRPGEVLSFSLLWEVLQKPKEDSDLSFFSHLIDHKGQMWGLGDANEYLSPEWKPGDLVLGTYDLSIRPDTPPGRYFIDIGMYDRLTADRLYLSGKDKADHLQIGLVRVQQVAPVSLAKVQSPAAVSLSNGIKFNGYDLTGDGERPLTAGEAIKPGDGVTLTLYWQTDSRQAEDYTVFLHLLDAQGKVVAQDDSQPAGNLFPTSFWDPGEVVADQHRLAIPRDLPSGDYAIEAGMYLLKTGERLGILKDGRVVDDHMILGVLKLGAR